MTRILLLRSVPLETDSRSSRMASQYQTRGYGVTPLVWTRGQPCDDDQTWAYTGSGGYGRGFRGLASRLRFAIFIIVQVFRRRELFDVVHAVDFDTACVAVPLAKLLRKKTVYDAFDHVGAILRPGLASRWLSRLEQRFIGWCDLAIFPEPIRLKQYGLTQTPTMHFIGNIPDGSDLSAIAPARSSSGPLTIAYVGTLEARHRALEWIPSLAARFPNTNWVVAGTGALAGTMESLAQAHPNLTFLGQVPYKQALAILNDADCHFGCYLLSSPAHAFAAPNKIYEHLALGRPLITNSGTPAGELVERYGTGFVFDGSPAGLGSVLEILSKAECQRRGANARTAWKDVFANLRGAQLTSFFDTLAKLVREDTKQ